MMPLGSVELCCLTQTTALPGAQNLLGKQDRETPKWGDKSSMLTLGFGGTHQPMHGLPEKTIDRGLVIPKEHQPTPGSALPFCKLLYLASQGNGYAMLSPGKKGSGCEGKQMFLPFWACVLAAPVTNIFIKPDTTQHDHDPLLFGRNTRDLQSLVLLTLSLPCNAIFS